MQGALPVFGVGGRQGACMEGSRPTAARRGAGCVPPVTQPLSSLCCWGAREGPGPHPTPPRDHPHRVGHTGGPSTGLYSPTDPVQPLGLDALLLLVRGHVLPKFQDAVREASVDIRAHRAQRPVPCHPRGDRVSSETFGDSAHLPPGATRAGQAPLSERGACKPHTRHLFPSPACFGGAQRDDVGGSLVVSACPAQAEDKNRGAQPARSPQRKATGQRHGEEAGDPHQHPHTHPTHQHGTLPLPRAPKPSPGSTSPAPAPAPQPGQPPPPAGGRSLTQGDEQDEQHGRAPPLPHPATPILILILIPCRCPPWPPALPAPAPAAAN